MGFLDFKKSHTFKIINEKLVMPKNYKEKIHSKMHILGRKFIENNSFCLSGRYTEEDYLNNLIRNVCLSFDGKPLLNSDMAELLESKRVFVKTFLS